MEHLNSDSPLYWDRGLKIIDIVLFCGSCNSRKIKKLRDWFKKEYCMERNINKETVTQSVKEYLKRNKIIASN